MINEKDFIYETILTGEFPFTLTVRVTHEDSGLYEDCKQYDNYKSNFITAKNKLLKRLEKGYINNIRVTEAYVYYNNLMDISL